MKGYKVFRVSYCGDWTGPNYCSPANWVIRSHRTLKAEVDTWAHRECSWGVNFYKDKEVAKSHIGPSFTVIFEGHTTKNAVVVEPYNEDTFDLSNKARTNSFRLDRVVGYYYRQTKIKRIPPKNIRNNSIKLDRFYRVRWSEKQQSYYVSKR